MNSDLSEIVVQCLRELGDFEGLRLPGPVDSETVLFGAGGILDSMGLVNLVILVEQCIADRHGIAVTIADRRALSQASSPFRTVRSLADYAQVLLREAA